MTHLLWYPGHELLLPDIIRAENCSLFDSRGKRYVDLESGVWCTSVGHGNPRVLRVLSDQAGRVGHTGFGYSSRIVEEAAADILSLLGMEGGSCVFLCSGSEAIEYGVRVAQSITDRPLLMTMADSYFGAYGSASKKQQTEWYSFDWMACSGCAESDHQESRCAAWASIPWDRIGGFLFEPGSSSGLVRFPPRSLVQMIVRTIRENHGLVLVNEVTTGLGRTGSWFGYQHYDITPDIVALGKGIGNGYPVSMTGFGPEATRRLGGDPPKYAQSHQNDPLGAAVAKEVIRVIRDEGLIERGREIASTLLDGLEGIRTRTRTIREIRARGLMIAMELNDSPTYSMTTRAHQELIRRGFVLARRPGTAVLRIDPAPTIAHKDVADFLATLEEVLTEIRSEVR